MASVKKIKDEINYITYDLINECFTFQVFHPEKEQQVQEVIREIIKTRNELVFRANHPEGKKEGIKIHFRKIWLDLGEMMNLVNVLSQEA